VNEETIHGCVARPDEHHSVRVTLAIDGRVRSYSMSRHTAAMVIRELATALGENVTDRTGTTEEPSAGG
jgi:hypothetical protein